MSFEPNEMINSVLFDQKLKNTTQVCTLKSSKSTLYCNLKKLSTSSTKNKWYNYICICMYIINILVCTNFRKYTEKSFQPKKYGQPNQLWMVQRVNSEKTRNQLITNQNRDAAVATNDVQKEFQSDS